MKQEMQLGLYTPPASHLRTKGIVGLEQKAINQVASSGARVQKRLRPNPKMDIATQTTTQTI